MSHRDQNSLIPTDKQYDQHYARYCIDCETTFTKENLPFQESAEGDICEDCHNRRVLDE